LRKNERDHLADCAKSCETFYCGGGSSGSGNQPSDEKKPTHPNNTAVETSLEAGVEVPSLEVAQHSMGDVPPEDFAHAFHFPLDLIKVTKSPLFSREECAKVVAAAEAEDVHLNEYVSGKYKLGGDWLINLPHTLKWFNQALESEIFPALAKLFPEVIRGPEVLRAHSVAMLKYNSSHPRTDVHVDNGILALTLALSPQQAYEGGGTFFEHMGDEPLLMDAGHATFRPGSVRHGGHTVTRGERYIIGAFILIQDKVEHVRRLTIQGRDARGKGDLLGAAEFFRWGLKVNPQCVTCRKNLGETLMAQGGVPQLTEAEALFTSALALTPKDTDAMYNLGGCLKAQGKVRESIEVYQGAMGGMNEDWELAYNLGVALGDEGRYAEEAEAYQQSLRVNPDYGQAWTNLGVACAKQGLLRQALQPFQKAVELEPTNSQNCLNLAQCYQALGMADEAKSAAAKAQSLSSFGSAGGGPSPGRAVEEVEDF